MGNLVISPDAAIRFLRGCAVLHNAYLRTAPLRTDAAGVFEILLRFLAPLDPERARGSLQPDQRTQFDAVIRALAGAGVLIDAGQHPPARPGTERAELLQRQLGLLANATAEIAGDLAALGPEALPGGSDSGDIALEHRLESLLNAVDAIRQGIATARETVVSRQLNQLRDAGRLVDMKLHVGAGASRLEGWVNVDVFPAELSLNVNRPLPFADGSARLIFASHILEHLYYPGEALRFLRECRRLLAAGGRLRLIVPDIEKYIRAYADGDDRFFAERRKTWRRLPEGRTLLEEFLAYAGTGPDPAAFLETHKYGYDFDTLAKTLRSAGFSRIERSTYDGSAIPDLRVDAVSEVAHAASDGRHYSLFVEAATQ